MPILYFLEALLLLGLVGAFVLALRQFQNLALQEVATQRRKVIGKDLALQMVILVLNNARREARELLVVLHEVLVEVAHTNRYGTNHILVNARN